MGIGRLWQAAGISRYREDLESLRNMIDEKLSEI